MDYQIGKNIRYYRELSGITQVDFAKMMGYENHTSITKIENGKRDVPLSKVAKMAEILNVNPAVFFKELPSPDYEEYIINIKRLEKEDPQKLRVIREMLGITEKIFTDASSSKEA